MQWAHSINPLAMDAAIVFIVAATLTIAGFALWVLYCLWLERTGEQPDYALRLWRRFATRLVSAPATLTTLLAGASTGREGG